MASPRAPSLKPKRALVHDLEGTEKKEVEIARERLQEPEAVLGQRVDGILAGQFKPSVRKQGLRGVRLQQDLLSL